MVSRIGKRVRPETASAARVGQSDFRGGVPEGTANSERGPPTDAGTVDANGLPGDSSDALHRPRRDRLNGEPRVQYALFGLREPGYESAGTFLTAGSANRSPAGRTHVARSTLASARPTAGRRRPRTCGWSIIKRG